MDAPLLPFQCLVPTWLSVHIVTLLIQQVPHMYAGKRKHTFLAAVAIMFSVAEQTCKQLDVLCIKATAFLLFSFHCCMLCCRVVRYRSLEEEFTGSSCRSDALRQALSAEDTTTNASLYILLRGVDQFYRKHRRCPGLYDQYALHSNSACLPASVQMWPDNSH